MQVKESKKLPNKKSDSIWKKRKKNLPKNWCQLLSVRLSKRGICLSPRQIKDVRLGVITDLRFQKNVWNGIIALEAKTIKARNKIKEMSK